MVTTICRRPSIAVILLFAVSGLLNAGGAPIFKECSACTNRIRVQPPDPRNPFILFHEPLRHLHGLCYDCAAGFSRSVCWNRKRVCPECRCDISSDVQDRIMRWPRERWHAYNVAQAKTVQAQIELGEARRMQQDAEVAARTEEAARSRRNVNESVTREVDMKRLLEEQMAAERETQEAYDVHRRIEEQMWHETGVPEAHSFRKSAHRGSWHARRGSFRCGMAESEQWPRPCQSFIRRYGAKIGVTIACGVIVGLIIWRAWFADDEKKSKRQRSFMARWRVRIGKLAESLSYSSGAAMC